MKVLSVLGAEVRAVAGEGLERSLGTATSGLKNVGEAALWTTDGGGVQLRVGGASLFTVWLLLSSPPLFFSLFWFVSSPSSVSASWVPGFRTERLQMARVVEQQSQGTSGPESCHVSHKSALQSRSHLPGRMSGSLEPGAAARGGSERCQDTVNKMPSFPQG